MLAMLEKLFSTIPVRPPRTIAKDDRNVRVLASLLLTRPVYLEISSREAKTISEPVVT